MSEAEKTKNKQPCINVHDFNFEYTLLRLQEEVRRVISFYETEKLLFVIDCYNSDGSLRDLKQTGNILSIEQMEIIKKEEIVEDLARMPVWFIDRMMLYALKLDPATEKAMIKLIEENE